MTAIRAIVFDLYGTLIPVRETPFRRRAARVVGASGREWADFLRSVLFVRPFDGRDSFVAAIVDRFLPAERCAAGERDAAAAQLLELLNLELESSRFEPFVRSLLGFFRRRGLRLALLSNSVSPFREPLERAGLGELFDAALFSCEIGAKKPDAAAYGAALTALEVRAEETLVVGDSLANDVLAPRELGMSALRIGDPQSLPGAVRSADLAWLAGFETGRLETLVAVGSRVALGDLVGAIGQIDLLPDARQGRYNLVAEVEVAWDAGFRERLFLKRYRHPESVRIEAFVRPLLAEVGIATNRVAIVAGFEPLLLAREVSGRRLDTAAPDPPLAFEIGRHFAAAFLFSNADFRPRNALLTELVGRPCLTLLDYEYTLFDRALDLSDLAERFDPRALARIPEAELLARGSRRVLSRAAIVRGRREFLDTRLVGPEALSAFRAGWIEVHAAAQAAADRIEAMLRDRLAGDPPLVVGTEAYRRALLSLDVDDVMARIALVPESACEVAF